MDALDQGMIVKVKDLSGRTIWDATLHNNGLCEQMISHMAQNMASRYRNWRGAYTENLYPVRTGFTTVGSVSIGFYGPFFLNDEDLSFINALNRLLALVALAALAAAICVGILMARGITVPLARVVAATQGIAGGKRDILLTGKTGVRELDRIASAVNELSRSLGRAGVPAPQTDLGHGARAAYARLQRCRATSRRLSTECGDRTRPGSPGFTKRSCVLTGWSVTWKISTDTRASKNLC